MDNYEKNKIHLSASLLFIHINIIKLTTIFIILKNRLQFSANPAIFFAIKIIFQAFNLPPFVRIINKSFLPIACFFNKRYYHYGIAYLFKIVKNKYIIQYIYSGRI